MKHFPAVEVIRQEMVAPDCYRLHLFAPEISASAKPGQFLHIRITPGLEPLLRRPFSVHAADRQKGEVAVLYRVVGRGTRLLAEKKKGETLDVMGPLGRGFTLPAPGQKAALVAGGIGIAPLFFLLQTLAGLKNSVHVLLGARVAKELLLIREIGAYKPSLMVATDDGSRGRRGPVTELLRELLAERKADRVYACGPTAMLKTVAALLQKHGVDGELSLEERMGCGVGACLSCVCKTSSKDGTSFAYRRVCLEGPVFPARDVIW